MRYSRAQEFSSCTISKANQEKRPAGATPSAFSCNCRLLDPVPLRFSALTARANEERAAVHSAVSIDSIVTTEKPRTLSYVGMARMHGGRFALPNSDTAIYRPIYLITKYLADAWLRLFSWVIIVICTALHLKM